MPELALRRLEAGNIQEQEGLAAAELIFAATPDFYGLIPLPHDDVLSIIASRWLSRVQSSRARTYRRRPDR
jgi:hypothetical protein